MRTTMKPPPPRLPAEGCVTASAKPTAIAASTALPPLFKIFRPTSLALASADATAPWIPTAVAGSAGSLVGRDRPLLLTTSAGPVGSVVSPGVSAVVAGRAGLQAISASASAQTGRDPPVGSGGRS